MCAALSHNMLDAMMNTLSLAAGLSCVYTNHRLRATTNVHMKRNGVEDHKICAVTGHRNVASLAPYNVITPLKHALLQMPLI